MIQSGAPDANKWIRRAFSNNPQDQRKLHVRILPGLHACNDATAQSAQSFARSTTAVLHGNLRLPSVGEIIAEQAIGQVLLVRRRVVT